MARIKVIDTVTGKKGTIDENQFDSSRFKVDRTVIQKFINSQALPIIGGVIGTVGTGGLPLGTVAGVGGGVALRDMLQGITGMPTDFESTRTTKDQPLEERVKATGSRAADIGYNVAKTAVPIQSVYQLYDSLATIFPKKVGVSRREKIIADKKLSSDDLEEALAKIDTSFQGKAKTGKVSQLRSELANKLFPLEGQTQNLAPGVWAPPLSNVKQAPFSDVYKQTINLEQANRPYTSSNTSAESAKLVSQQTRQLLNQLGGKDLQKINKQMARGYKLKNIKDWIINSFAKKAAFRAIP